MAIGEPVVNQRRWTINVTHENGVSFTVDTGIAPHSDADGDEALEDLAAHLTAWNKRHQGQPVYAVKLGSTAAEWAPEE